MSNSDKPAYPIHLLKAVPRNGFGGVGEYELRHQGGLTKREMFAMAAMQGLCANSVPGSHHSPTHLCAEAIEYADALLKQLEYADALLRQLEQ